ncbi:hypothetical protein PUN28_009471 [Cardiocondyla obscurior]|uniref:Uncharacterized protein n=1 Tax=Cardiocondyla obscurior TaxID=286306 RepID=A0AAW2FST6_9HYME
MAPTICVSEVPMVGTAVRTYVRRRQRTKSDAKRPIFALEEILRNGTIAERFLLPDENCPRRSEGTNMVTNYSMAKVRSREHATNVNKSYRQLVEERRDLLSIVIRTIHLVRRNHLLQKRLDALRAETQQYLSSLSSNPEDQSDMPRIAAHPEESSSAEEDTSNLTSPLDADATRCSFRDSPCRDRKCPDGESSSGLKIRLQAEVDSSSPGR